MGKKLKAIFTNKSLMIKILITLVILVLYKIGTMIAVPTVHNLSDADGNNFLVMMNYLSGSYLGQFTFLSLGLSPYITSSIVIQLLGMGVIKPFERWKEEGEAGRKKTDKATFILATILSIFEGFILVYSFDKNFDVLINNRLSTYLITVAMLVAGSLITMGMAHLITKKGIGNGSSLIIFAGIASRIGYDIYWTGSDILDFSSKMKGLKTMGLFGLYLLFFLVIVSLIIFLDKSVKRMKVEYSKESEEFIKANSSIPIKVNLAGVIPVIFTVSIMTGLAFLGAYSKFGIFTKLGNYSSVMGACFYAFLIIFFTRFYASEIFNAETIAKNIKKGNAVVEGVLPGEDTENYVKGVISDMSLIGGIGLCLIALIPIITSAILPHDYNLTLGGTSVMILAGVAIETIDQIKAKINTAKSTKLKLFD